jgi:hypothetical protein
MLNLTLASTTSKGSQDKDDDKNTYYMTTVPSANQSIQKILLDCLSKVLITECTSITVEKADIKTCYNFVGVPFPDVTEIESMNSSCNTISTLRNLEAKQLFLLKLEKSKSDVTTHENLIEAFNNIKNTDAELWILMGNVLDRKTTFNTSSSNVTLKELNFSIQQLHANFSNVVVYMSCTMTGVFFLFFILVVNFYRIIRKEMSQKITKGPRKTQKVKRQTSFYYFLRQNSSTL